MIERRRGNRPQGRALQTRPSTRIVILRASYFKNCLELGPTIKKCSHSPSLLCAQSKFLSHVSHLCVAPQTRCRRRFGVPSLLVVCHAATTALSVFAQRLTSEISTDAFQIAQRNFSELCLFRLRCHCVALIEIITANRPHIRVTNPVLVPCL